MTIKMKGEKKIEYDKFGHLRDKSEADMFNRHALGYCDVCGGLVTNNGDAEPVSAHKVKHKTCPHA